AVAGTGARSNIHLPRARDLGLPTQAELLDEGTVALDVLALQVVEETATATHEAQQTPARVVIFGVLPKVLGEVVDPPGQERDLHLRRSGVRGPTPVLLDDFLLDFLGEAHGSPLVGRLRSPRPP